MPSKHTPRPCVSLDQRPDGSLIATSPLPLPPVARSLPHRFEATAEAHPERIFMRQRVTLDGEWRQVSYRQALQSVRAIAQWFVADGARHGDVVAIISGNSIEHALIMLGAQTAGMAVAPLSVAYALLATDHSRLTHCVAQVSARYAFASDGQAFDKAFSALSAAIPTLRFIAAGASPSSVQATPLDELLATVATPAVAKAMAAITHENVARLMFTSGSTGSPKAVPQTQGCLAVTVAQAEAMGLLDFGGEGPQHLEAMPFSHIMAGNFNFNNVLAAGGTIHLDDGKPTPQLFQHTLQNLREISPHFFLTVPIGYAMLCDAMEADAGLCAKFFKNLRYMGFGGAVLPEQVASRLQKLAMEVRGESIPIYSFYGATEFMFGAMQYWGSGPTDVIGLPVPGVEIKLASLDGKLEFRVRGPTLMAKSGYVGASIPHEQLFDEEGFFRTGDAVRWLDPQVPEQGLVFDGRIAEDFKLSTGTWVSVASVRVGVVSACDPLIREAVICGLNERWLGALLWLNESAVRASLGITDTALTGNDLARDSRVKQALRRALSEHNQKASGSARRIQRALIMVEPLAAHANEVTDKGNANQRSVRTRRAADVERLYRSEPSSHPDIVDLGD
ncbi:AMP-binding protein [Steroidobacter sp.]|uniref:AMP-binding protein n=1 Tax=Steroidobacter sp. TaxID=1978227 RepID=UPI001A6256FA|nr:AMP-binding protein [Steroidobacter sp.]MBL8270068.1 AMP-binding protein [Steroidobacter sp.]